MQSSSSSASSCGSDLCGTRSSPPILASTADKRAVTYRIPAMDCVSEEQIIRQAFEDVPIVGSLRFELGLRRLAGAVSPRVFMSTDAWACTSRLQRSSCRSRFWARSSSCARARKPRAAIRSLLGLQARGLVPPRVTRCEGSIGCCVHSDWV